MITMIDMRVGNLDSVRKAFDRIGVDVRVSSEAADVEQASVIVLPGVGSFSDGMRFLQQKRLVEPIRRGAIEKKKPLLGICLGMQLLADGSDEHGHHKGLGLIPGRVVRLQPHDTAFRVPNMGWCDVTFHNRVAPFDAFSEPEAFYFAHSYHFECSDSHDMAGTIEYDGIQIAAVVHRGYLFGVQFHPEKSQDPGLQVLDGFFRHLLRESLI